MRATRKRGIAAESSPRQWRVRRERYPMEPVTRARQCISAPKLGGWLACLLATVDLTKPRVHLYERILHGRRVEGRLVIRSLKLTTGLSARGRRVATTGNEGSEDWRIGGWRVYWGYSSAARAAPLPTHATHEGGAVVSR